jgi:hypothetical protein
MAHWLGHKYKNLDGLEQITMNAIAVARETLQTVNTALNTSA